jgi:hypothetical protein
MRLRFLALLAVIVALAAPATVTASRQPTPSEQTAITAAALRKLAPIPARCLTFRLKVSTVDHLYALAIPLSSCPAHATDGWLMLKLSSSGWRVISTGTSPPLCTLYSIDDVVKDLFGAPCVMKLTQHTASFTFGAYFYLAGSHVPAREGPPCPAQEIIRGRAYCMLEYEFEGRWYLVSGYVNIKGRSDTEAHGGVIRSWLRGWRQTPMSCARSWGDKGTLSSNDGACHGDIANDIDTYLRLGHPAISNLSSHGTNTAGFDSFYGFNCRRSGRVFLCTNALGDAFRYVI